MNITKITLTGADNTTSQAELLSLVQQFPFVEFGILFSEKRIGEPRYPTSDWLKCLSHLNNANQNKIKLSAHLCHGFSHDVTVNGNISFMETLAESFGRIQLNFRDNDDVNIHVLNERLFEFHARCPETKVIIQHNHNNLQICNKLYKSQGNYNYIQFLFDASEGKGKTPERWPNPVWNADYGYAGGLATIGNNFSEQLEAINEAAGNSSIWLDMESGVRGNMDEFNLSKAASILEKCESYIT